MNCFNRCWYSREDDAGAHVIADEELGDLTVGESILMNQTWSEFKGDVSMKTLINNMDTCIKRRRRLYTHENPNEEQLI